MDGEKKTEHITLDRMFVHSEGRESKFLTHCL